MGKFLDTEVRHYSSGMFMRLAFATAVHTECDIFLIDEVLVGRRPAVPAQVHAQDHGAQGERQDHGLRQPQPAQVLRVCNRGLVLEKGELVFEGPAEDAVKKLGYELDEDDDE